MEPYVISELESNSGKSETLAGAARTQSVGPAFGIAEIKPLELNVTTLVDRNISPPSPANYYDKISGMAMRAIPEAEIAAPRRRRPRGRFPPPSPKPRRRHLCLPASPQAEASVLPEPEPSAPPLIRFWGK
nr:hypothetical protein [uncultured Oscillibacter sp.]